MHAYSVGAQLSKHGDPWGIRYCNKIQKKQESLESKAKNCFQETGARGSIPLTQTNHFGELANFTDLLISLLVHL